MSDPKIDGGGLGQTAKGYCANAVAMAWVGVIALCAKSTSSRRVNFVPVAATLRKVSVSTPASTRASTEVPNIYPGTILAEQSRFAMGQGCCGYGVMDFQFGRWVRSSVNCLVLIEMVKQESTRVSSLAQVRRG